MTDLLEARAIAAQLIHNAIQRIDSETAAHHIIDTMDEGTDVDTLAFAADNAVREAAVYLDWDSGTRWHIDRGGETLRTVTSLAEAQTIGQLLIRAETGDRTVTIRWVCAVCDSEEEFCPSCGGDGPSMLVARGILTNEYYEIIRVDKPAA